MRMAVLRVISELYRCYEDSDILMETILPHLLLLLTSYFIKIRYASQLDFNVEFRIKTYRA